MLFKLISLALIILLLFSLGFSQAKITNGKITNGAVKVGAGAITLQHKTSGLDFSGSDVSSINLTAFSLGSGNLVYVFVRYGVGDVSSTSVTDTAGNTYTQIDAIWDATTQHGSSAFYAKNTTANGSNVINIAFTPVTLTPKYVLAMAIEYSGLNTTSPLDQHHSKSVVNPPGASTIVSNSFTTTSANEVLIQAACSSSGQGAFNTPDTGYTIQFDLAVATDHYGTAQDKIVSSIQTGVTATTTGTNNTGWTMNLSTFKQ